MSVGENEGLRKEHEDSLLEVLESNEEDAADFVLLWWLVRVLLLRGGGSRRDGWLINHLLTGGIFCGF